MGNKLIVAGLVLVAVSGGIGYAAGVEAIPDMSTLDAKALKIVLPDTLDWKPAPGLPGTDVAALVGDAGKPGFYVVLDRFHPGNFSHPHYHANDRYIMVVKGTWWVGTGAKWDPEHATVPIKAGTFVTHIGKEVHYDGARSGSDEAIVMIFGQGPGARVECEGPKAETGPGPCDTARKALAAR
jgi:hypothetical protein